MGMSIAVGGSIWTRMRTISRARRPKKRKRPMASAARVAMIMPPTTAVIETMRLDWIAVTKLSCFTARAKLSKVIDEGHRVWS